MLIIPAIDIRTGRVVRLLQGDFTKETFYSGRPADVAKRWQEEGARLLHVVDLDGALAGEPKNIKAIEEIKDAVNIPIEVGGGLRSEDAVEMILSMGVSRAIVGTRAYTDEGFLKRLLKKFGDRIAVSVDAAGESVVAEGWRYDTAIKATEIAKRAESLGVKTIIYTDVLRDGTLGRPRIESVKAMLEAVKIDIIASGGISSIQDIKDIKELGKKNLAGAIVGKALYEGKIDLTEAIRIAEAG